MRNLAAVLGAWLVVGPVALHAESVSLGQFRTPDGLCSESELAALGDAEGFQGYTVTIQKAEVFTERGISPFPAGVQIPAMTALRCHTRVDDKVLVSTENGTPYCGWIEAGAILQTVTKSNSVLLGTDLVCGSIRPLSVAQFCDKLRTFNESTEACEDPRASRSSFDTKFLVWNAVSAGGRALDRTEAPVYEDAGETVSRGAVGIFNVLRVYDVQRGRGGLAYLIGSSERDMLGWIDAGDGAIWYSKLAVFFAQEGKGDVLLEAPGVPGNRVLATRPSNLRQMADGAKEFRRFPVLFDRRGQEASDPDSKKPHLEVGFIGTFCDEGQKQLCVGSNGERPWLDPVVAEQADIVFLIDATKSMSVYFETVARAVGNVAREFVGSPNYWFGVALYGDYMNRSAMQLHDNVQWREAIPLEALSYGTEFDDLPDEPLFIKDPIGDRPEAIHAAIIKTAQATKWRGRQPRFIIHIGDHGDRVSQAGSVVKALNEGQIFYIPIAVRGDYSGPNNDAFVKQANAIVDLHTTPGRLPMGTRPRITYDASKTETDEGRYDAIAGALRSALDLGNVLQDEVLADLYKEKPAPDANDGRRLNYPPGYAALTAAARELFFGEMDRPGNGGRNAIAARGFVETVGAGETEDNWSYFAMIRPGDLQRLETQFDLLCVSMRDTDATKDAEDVVFSVISILTGDLFGTVEDQAEAFRDRDKIPLSTRTMLGEGLIELVRDLASPSQEARARIVLYQREVCRTRTLLNLMRAQRRLARPFETRFGPNGGETGDLIWNEDDRKYNFAPEAAQKHDWVFEDDFGDRVVFLPLDYLPDSPKRVVGSR